VKEAGETGEKKRKRDAPQVSWVPNERHRRISLAVDQDERHHRINLAVEQDDTIEPTSL